MKKKENKLKGSFSKVAANENNPKWENMIKRENILYGTKDIRSPFERDFNRILHTNAYNRLKHKTQVFFSPENDHICTRIEHVNYVESISYTISNFLGLNSELTRAIACGHDVGHGPFGHVGEKIISEISKRDINENFWHEKNGLNILDNIEILENYETEKENLNLTYAVRDGIISHCGEVDENSLKPRDEAIALNEYKYPNEYSPYTWEGCIVKISDKISYLGRDIDDAIEEKILLDEDLIELQKILNAYSIGRSNSSIINTFVNDICANSSPEEGIKLSKKGIELMNKIKEFNYKHIYSSKRLKPANEYFKIVINQIYETLKETFDKENSVEKLKELSRFYPELCMEFLEWINKYWDIGNRKNLKNKIIFNANNREDYFRAIIYYISGMTDKYAIDMYNKIISF